MSRKDRPWNDDPFTKKARRENYEARSIYKLSEIDKRERIFGGVKIVLDLGAAPGSWTQYCLEKLPHGKVVAVDLSPLRVEDPRLTFLHGPIEEVDVESALGGQKADLVLSDMAPKTSGIHDRDVFLSFELASFALDHARKYLKPGGTFIVKLFMGESFEEYHRMLKSTFTTVKLLRPESTRKHSREIFFIGKGFKSA
jgi:23S rRNA (uridine2552-2'-O)-methyltransferase